MYILFEEHQYNSHDVETILKDIYVLQDVDKKVSVKYVGYFYNPHLNDCVFILPKVLLRYDETDKCDYLTGVTLEDGKPATPEQVMTPENQDKLNKEYKKFIFEFAVWIYRAICVYYNDNPKSKAILFRRLPKSGKGKRSKANTFLDIVLSLIQFNNENRDFVLFTIKNIHKGNNKINWTKTISHTTAFLQDDEPIYGRLINKKRIINNEEELFVIFFSILNYLNDEFGFSTPISFQYDLITGKIFQHYLQGAGKTKLLQIKYKYFSDKALQLWDLCFAFFEKSHAIAINNRAQEYILAKSFHVVFEDMIDELIGTPHSDIPKGLADQEDGKRVDHLYTDLALTSVDQQKEREVYYIGDSKYYKSGNNLSSESIYKQFTYARNVIQWNINLFLDNDEVSQGYKSKYDKEEDQKRFGKIHLQDSSITEGYDIIPNFFISAFVNDDLKYKAKENIRKHTDNNSLHSTEISYQFPDRLFDRDTLLLSHYDVNFLYVLFLYARNKQSEKAFWKQEVRDIFRREIRDVVQKRFQIYAMRAKLGVNGMVYVKDHFYDLNGRVYQPYGEDNEAYFAYARPKDKFEETESQYEELKRYFHIKECNMGENPKETLWESQEEELKADIVTPKWLTMHYLERDPSRGVLLGFYRSKEQLQWILGNNDKSSLVYNVREIFNPKNQENDETDDNRDGAHTAGFYDKKKISFVILYSEDSLKTGEYRVFHVRDTAKHVKRERMIKTGYPHEVKSNSYYFFRFDEEVSIGNVDFINLLEAVKTRQKDEQGGILLDGEPLFSTAAEVLKFIRR